MEPVSSADVKLLTKKQTIQWTIHRYAALHNRKWMIGCPPLACHGRLWSLELWPFGTEGNSRCVTVFLKLHYEENTPGQLRINSRICFDNPWNDDLWYDFPDEPITKTNPKLSLYPSRVEMAFDFCGGDTLTVMVEIEEFQQQHSNDSISWTPSDFLSTDMLRILDAGKGADVTLAVGSKIFPAHRLILAVRAPVLAELAEDVPRGTRIQLKGVDESIFTHVLRFIYAGKNPFAASVKPDPCAVLEAADRFGCAALKHLSEYRLVRNNLSADNAAKLLLFADGHGCALLKEAAMRLIVANPKAIKSSPWWDEVVKSDSLMVEIAKASLFGGSPTKDGLNAVESMDIKTLWKNLGDAGLSIDGTREMLVERLKAHRDSH